MAEASALSKEKLIFSLSFLFFSPFKKPTYRGMYFVYTNIYILLYASSGKRKEKKKRKKKKRFKYLNKVYLLINISLR